MKTLTTDELLDIAAYERVRDARIAEIIELKRIRRVAIGPLVTLLFENRDTVRHQVHEMMRAERIVEERAIQVELEAYNPLIPADSELSATLFIEVTDQDRVREVLDRFIGLDEQGRVQLRFEGGALVPGTFESGRSREDRISAVHFVKFRLGAAQREAFRAGRGRIDLIVRHPSYEAESEISPETRRALAGDLA